MNPLISVIVPVYNVESLLPRCLNSIVLQTYANLEILLIDDGSTDESLEICRSYEREDSRIKVLTKPNGGQGSARNMGLSICKGDLITFVDSDDWLVKEIYEHVVQLFNKLKIDIVSFNTIQTNGDEKLPEVTDQVVEVNGVEILEDYLYRGQTEVAPFTVWRKVYSKSILENLRFDEKTINEDILFNYSALEKADKLVHTNKVGYYYFQENKSTTRSGLKKRDFDLLEVSKELVEVTQKSENERLIYLAKVKKARTYFSLLAKIAYYGVSDENISRKKTIKELTANIRENYLLLIKSPMSFNRKLMVTVLAVNYNILAIPLKIYKQFK
ncbi:glycosyltransferase family 2 protein [Lacticigenium naphthae]|uniref:glycosyltransferase family 2 protein n=1 Tax=Lacticigenium naphthae TaxID=515351 RepID=UPI0004267606|nr:glycosyltransferase [Lacticigenium naphthae]